MRKGFDAGNPADGAFISQFALYVPTENRVTHSGCAKNCGQLCQGGLDTRENALYHTNQQGWKEMFWPRRN